MKSSLKKILISAAAVICVLACIFAVSACDGKGGDDGKIVNTEFSEYLQKVTAVLKDYNIQINENSGAAPANALISVAGYEENKSVIANLIKSDKNVMEDVESVSNARVDIFQQSLYAGIIIGDGMTTYHNEKNFYGIPVYIEDWHQYFEVTSSGNATFVRCYTEESENTSQSCITLRLDFNSASDYSFVFIQSAEYGVTYAYGNSDKEFLAFSYTNYADSCFAMYSDSMDNGYYLVSQNTVGSIKEYFNAEINAVNIDDFTPLKNKRYSLNKTQSDTIAQKYFKSSSGSGVDDREKGLMTQSYKGVTVAQQFVADGEEELVIPEGVDYIAQNFIIETNGHRIKRLSLPASLKGVARAKENDGIVEGGKHYIDYEIINAKDMLIECRDRERNYLYALEEVKVAGGNTAYKSEQGHLFTLDGDLAYLVNAPISRFEMFYMYINEFMGELFYNGEYDKLIADIREISISSDDMNREGNNYIDLLFLKLTKLETLNISTYNLDSGESGGYFEFIANNNITVNIKLNSDTQYIALNIKDAAAPVSITLNLLELCETENAVLDVFANSGEGSNILDVRVNANCNELDYVTKYYKGISVEGFNTSVFTYAQELIIEGFKFRALQDYGNVYGLELTEFTDGGEVVVPDNIQGFEIGVVLLPAEMLQGKTLRIILPQASDTVGRMAVHIISYGEEGGNYPFVQGLNNGRLMNENISLVLPCDNTDIGVDVLSDGHILRAEYNNTYEILMDGSTYEQIDKVNIAVLVGAYEHTIYNVPLATVNNRAEMYVDALEGYKDWEDLTLTDDEGNLYPVTITEEKAYFYVPKDFTQRQLRIVGDNEVALTINLLGERALEVAVPRNYKLLLQEKVNDDGSRDVYYGIAYNHDIEEEIFAFALPEGKTIGYMVEYEFNDLWSNYGKKASVELDLRDVEYYEITFMLHNPYKSDDEVIRVSRFGERARIIFPDVDKTFVDGSGNNLYFKCWTQYGREYPDEVIDSLTAGQDERYTAKYIGDRALNVSFIMQGQEVGHIQVQEDEYFFVGEVIDETTKIRSVYFNLYEYEWSQQYDKRQIICQLPQGKMLSWEYHKYEFYNLLKEYGTDVEINLEIMDVEYYEITFAMRSPVNYEEVTAISTVRIEKRCIIPFPDMDEYIMEDNNIFRFVGWLDEDGGGTSPGYEMAYRNMTYYARYEWYASDGTGKDEPLE